MFGTTSYPFHDGYLDSISVTDGRAVLGLRRSDGSAYRMTLAGVQALSVDGFREGNVILELWSVTGRRSEDGDAPTETLAETMEILFPAPHPSAAAHYQEHHRAIIADKLDEVASGEAAIVGMVPAYGADLLAFCASITLETMAGDGEA